MSTEKLPAIQFYPGDWKRDTGIQMLDLEERGVWFELILMMHESDRRGYLTLKGSAFPDEMVAKLLGIHGNKWKKIKRKLIDVGVASIEYHTGILFNRRMARDEEKRHKLRENGKKGGNPNFKKGQPNPYYNNQEHKPEDNQKDNQNISPSTSSSTSSSVSTSPSKTIKEESGSEYDQEFLKFWDSYPKKVGKKTAYKAWSNLPDDRPQGYQIASVVRKYKERIWRNTETKFIPNPSTFLNQRYYEDIPVDPDRGKEGRSWDATEEDIANLKEYAKLHEEEFSEYDKEIKEARSDEAKQ